MEEYSLTKVGNQLRLDQFPNSVKVVEITTEKARHFAHLALHKADLDFAEAALLAINEVSEQPVVVKEALWRTAIVFTLKCFAQHASRSSLNEEKIFADNALALEVFNFFKSLRDKHFVHDQNSYSNCKVGLVINAPEAPRKVEKAVALTTSAVTLDQNNFSNLRLVIKGAVKWVLDESDKVANSITEEFEKLSYEDIANREELKITTPRLEEIHMKRKK